MSLSFGPAPAQATRGFDWDSVLREAKAFYDANDVHDEAGNVPIGSDGKPIKEQWAQIGTDVPQHRTLAARKAGLEAVYVSDPSLAVDGKPSKRGALYVRFNPNYSYTAKPRAAAKPKTAAAKGK